MTHIETGKHKKEEALSIINSNKWIFKSGEAVIQVIKKDGVLYNSEGKELSDIKFRLILSHSKRNDFLDQLHLSWIYESFPYPEIIINKYIFDLIISSKINNALDITSEYLKDVKISDIISDKQFYEGILKNSEINRCVKLEAAIAILSITNNVPFALENIDILTNRLLNNSHYRYMCIRFYDVGIKADLSERLLDNQWYNIKINYTSTPSLPDNCCLISNIEKTYEKGASAIQHENDWSKMVNKEIFLVRMKEPEQISYYIRNYKNTGWFDIEKIYLDGGSLPSKKALGAMYRSISSDKNQQFFQKNHHKQILRPSLLVNFNLQQLMNNI